MVIVGFRTNHTYTASKVVSYSLDVGLRGKPVQLNPDSSQIFDALDLRFSAWGEQVATETCVYQDRLIAWLELSPNFETWSNH